MSAKESGRNVVAGIGVRGWLRFIWRQLTSMSVALMLLMLLAIAAIPGSVIPQKMSNPQGYARYIEANPDRVAWMEKLQLFDVYTSVWFSAVYILLFVSLIGCILPRIRVHYRALRNPPPRAPKNLLRLPAHAQASGVTRDDEEMRRRAVGWLRRSKRYRVICDDEPGGALVVRAERGYARETGNLIFHIALVGLLVSVAIGQLYHYRGQVILVQGRGFANAQVDYDSFSAGSAFDPASMCPFRMTLDQFDAKFRVSDAQAQDFTAHVTIDDNATSSKEQIKVNHPLIIGGAKIYLQGNGYAPEVEVKDADGEVAFAGAVPFIAQDNVYTSLGTIKVPDVTSGDQIGLVGYLLPSAEQSESGAWKSVYPDLLDPVLVLTVWRGDLGLDNGIPQNVYELDTDNMTQVAKDGKVVTLVVRPGETVDLPDDLGSFTFNGVKRYVALDLRHDPSLTMVLIASIAAVIGLAMSLFIPRRRMWVRIAGAVASVGGLAKTEDENLQREVRSLAEYIAAPDKAPPVGPGQAIQEGKAE
ncbi:cytochrome c biogenesis protein ResB [Rarobacter incanus]|uniref:Cytochrome c biogenesis protein n=1 Tax=Rarobacter incanus TaxID=153494 RepID=A0A542SQQ9_9MICO|nr:cytochrome c biogenesis protein ResB [Rarobacter incanus]TQK76949.1 cytochrome c biogenesis protein [Rarobacter incanus]